MVERFQPKGLPVLIGSLPFAEHEQALKLVLDYTPEIPLWTQLPVHREEGMVAQFMAGMPGLCATAGGGFIDTARADFDGDLIHFYEEYLGVIEGNSDLSDSRFILNKDTTRGFFLLIESLKRRSAPPVALKGQMTGPFTFCTGILDQNKKAIIYDEQVKDAALKLLAMKSRWQVRQLSQFGCPVIIFFDEPALAGFGSSEFISISSATIVQSLEEVIAAVHAEGALAGVHVCANTDWSLILDSAADIVSFDAYSYFDKLILYPDLVKRFVQSGGILAWGIVPTLNSHDIEKETSDSLVVRWEEQARAIQAMGIDKSTILSQTLITPSCGTGSLSLDHAKKVLVLTRQVSDIIREKYL